MPIEESTIDVKPKSILLIPGAPATMTAQQKGISFRQKTVFTKAVVEAEAKRLRRDLLIYQDGNFVPPRYPVKPYDGPLYVQIRMIYPMTITQAAKYADRLSDPGFTLRHTVRPDVDNSAKLLLDTLTKLGFWHDDAQVDELHLCKRYGSEPRITIWILSLNEDA